VFSATGTFIQSVSGAWLMLELTNSNTWVGLMVASVTLPLLFLALASGALADMFERTKLMVVAQGIMGGSAAAMAVLTFLDIITPGILLALGLLLGVGVALNIPAWQALLPDLVPRGLVASAVALQSVAFNGARSIGPALGGLLILAYGPEAGFAVNALSYLVVIVVLLVIGPRLEAQERESASMGSAISMGIRFARFTPPFRSLLTLVALFAITSSVVQATLPNHTRLLGGSEATYGILLGAMGAGALVGAFLRPRIVERTQGRTVPYAITLFGAAGLTLGMAPNLAVAGGAMFAAGLFWLMALSTLRATAQLMAPGWIRGRVMSMYTLAFAGILPLGSILAGVVADQLGTDGALVVFSLGAIVIGLFSPRLGVPDLEEVETPEFSAERAVQPHAEVSLEGGPVIVLNTWKIDEEDFAEFTNLMNQVRLVRLTTGAYRWRLFRSISDPTLLTELFAVESWEEHLAQHTRIDDASAALITRARSFDRAGGPRTQHLIAIDVEHPPDFEELIATHDEMHRTDGSIPVEADQEV
jgi:MFS family permease